MSKNQVRIIGGQWRSRKIDFPNTEGLRPTPDRVRETLFNWLMPHITGARCLDLFAGSGALSFEALSRGAAFVVAIDQAPEVISKMQENASILGANDQLQLHCADIHTWLTDPEKTPLFNSKFDVVFLDPPFHQGWVLPLCEWLEKIDCLASGALVYVEAERGLTPLPIPSHWVIHRSQAAGQVAYYLVRRGARLRAREHR